MFEANEERDAGGDEQEKIPKASCGFTMYRSPPLSLPAPILRKTAAKEPITEAPNTSSMELSGVPFTLRPLFIS